MQALACVCPLGSLSLQREAGWCYPTIWPGSSATAPGFGGILGDIAHHVGGHGSNHTARFHALAPRTCWNVDQLATKTSPPSGSTIQPILKLPQVASVCLRLLSCLFFFSDYPHLVACWMRDRVCAVLFILSRLLCRFINSTTIRLRVLFFFGQSIAIGAHLLAGDNIIRHAILARLPRYLVLNPTTQQLDRRVLHLIDSKLRRN